MKDNMSMDIHNGKNFQGSSFSCLIVMRSLASAQIILKTMNLENLLFPHTNS